MLRSGSRQDNRYILSPVLPLFNPNKNEYNGKQDTSYFQPPASYLLFPLSTLQPEGKDTRMARELQTPNSKLQTPRRGAVFGLAAHVDAGKTTLSESMLFLSGAVRRQGRVDHGDAFLDTDQMEKERGITIFSKEARLQWKKTEITLVDTPGHVDFSGETERAMAVMDAAILVVSAPEGVQSHTRTLWELLEKNGIPTVLFVNKMDSFQGDRKNLYAMLTGELSDRAVVFPDPDPEKLAMADERCLDAYLREGAVSDDLLWASIRERRLFPCFFGAALKNEGVEELLDFLASWEKKETPRQDFGALVYKVARDPQGARLAFLRVTGGVLKPRDLLTLKSPEGETVWAEKAAELRLYSGARYTSAQEVRAGELCCVVGLSQAKPGDGLGTEEKRRDNQLRPCYVCRLIPAQGSDLHYVLDCLQTLEEEEPLIQTEYLERQREIRVHSMGEVYLEILKRRMKDRFGLEVSFSAPGVVYRETIAAPVEGVGHYEPLRHYAEVHLLLTPLSRGSGLQFTTEVSTDDLALNWQRLILTHLREKVHVGVLTGSPITDMKISLVAGKAHLKHTEGGDFRQATYRALRQGLMKASSLLLEPAVTMEIRVPEEHLGRVMSDLSQMGGIFGSPEDAGEGMKRLTAEAPAAACADYPRQISILTKGKGQVATAFRAWKECPDQEEIVARIGYDPQQDLYNSPDSVFCSHGAGVTVSWDQVEMFMHLPSLKEKREQQAVSAPRIIQKSVQDSREEDAALQRIFEKTYGPVKARQLMPPAREEKEEKAEKPALQTPAESQPEILLVDGYNVLYAWEEWETLMAENLEGARLALMELMCNYAGATGKRVILVFDAYRVKGNPGTAERYNNIFVIYTREAQTADAFIEQTTYTGRQTGRIRVVTSDQPEQLIAVGNSALRTSAREFRREVIRVKGSIAAFLEKNNRFRHVGAMEKAYKDAWKRSRK